MSLHRRSTKSIISEWHLVQKKTYFVPWAFEEFVLRAQEELEAPPWICFTLNYIFLISEEKKSFRFFFLEKFWSKKITKNVFFQKSVKKWKFQNFGKEFEKFSLPKFWKFRLFWRFLKKQILGDFFRPKIFKKKIRKKFFSSEIKNI